MMTKKDRDELKKALAAQKKKMASKQNSKAFLVGLGVFTAGGKVSKRYKDSCTPRDQD